MEQSWGRKTIKSRISRKKNARPAAATVERPWVAALDEILGLPIRVLDDGFVRLVDYMGDRLGRRESCPGLVWQRNQTSTR